MVSKLKIYQLKITEKNICILKFQQYRICKRLLNIYIFRDLCFYSINYGVVKGALNYIFLPRFLVKTENVLRIYIVLILIRNGKFFKGFFKLLIILVLFILLINRYKIIKHVKLDLNIY